MTKKKKKKDLNDSICIVKYQKRLVEWKLKMGSGISESRRGGGGVVGVVEMTKNEQFMDDIKSSNTDILHIKMTAKKKKKKNP